MCCPLYLDDYSAAIVGGAYILGHRKRYWGRERFDLELLHSTRDLLNRRKAEQQPASGERDAAHGIRAAHTRGGQNAGEIRPFGLRWNATWPILWHGNDLRPCRGTGIRRRRAHPLRDSGIGLSHAR
jgi:hypothetical protein